MSLSPDQAALLSSLRVKAAQGELTEEDMRLHIIPFLRGERKSAVQQAAKKRKAAVSQTKSAEDMLRELE